MIKLKSLLMEADPGDPSQSTVDISSIMSELKSACNTFNTEIANKTKLNLGNNGLTTLVTPEGMIAEGPYIAITSPFIQNTYGTKNPYGYIGVELSKGRYLGNSASTPRGITLPAFLLYMNSFIDTAIGGKPGTDKGNKFISKFKDQINAAGTTLFNTVDPIFKKLLAYKGYNSATTATDGKVTISKTA
jgi:hypothetical protein